MNQFKDDTYVESEATTGKRSYSLGNNKRRSVGSLAEFAIPKPAAFAITLGLLLAAAIATRYFEIISGETRPFTLFFLIPVAFAAVNFGVPGGLLTALATIAISRLYLFPAEGSHIMLSRAGDMAELGALVLGTTTIALVAGRLQVVLQKLRKTNAELKVSEQQRQNFSSEVLMAVTGGVLRLCNADEIAIGLEGEPDISMNLSAAIDSTEFRHRLVQEARSRGVVPMRTDDLVTAVTEAATNAIKHAGGGAAAAWFAPDAASVLIEDHGEGISPSRLARATLERGYSTRMSLGMGFYMMIGSVDDMALCTSSRGTAILLTVRNEKKTTVEQNILAGFPSV